MARNTKKISPKSLSDIEKDTFYAAEFDKAGRIYRSDLVKVLANLPVSEMNFVGQNLTASLTKFAVSRQAPDYEKPKAILDKVIALRKELAKVIHDVALSTLDDGEKVYEYRALELLQLAFRHDPSLIGLDATMRILEFALEPKNSAVEEARQTAGQIVLLSEDVENNIFSHLEKIIDDEPSYRGVEAMNVLTGIVKATDQRPAVIGRAMAVAERVMSRQESPVMYVTATELMKECGSINPALARSVHLSSDDRLVCFTNNLKAIAIRAKQPKPIAG